MYDSIFTTRIYSTKQFYEVDKIEFNMNRLD